MHEKNPVTVVFGDALSLDRLYELSTEYSVQPSALIELAVKRLIADVDFIRDLRAGKLKPKA